MRSTLTAPSGFITIFSVTNLMKHIELLEKGIVSLRDLYILESLKRRGALEMPQLTDPPLMDRAVVHLACKRLEKRGFLERTHSSRDRRVVTVSLTPKGHALPL